MSYTALLLASVMTRYSEHKYSTHRRSSINLLYKNGRCIFYKKITISSTSCENLLELLLDMDLQNTDINTAPIAPPPLSLSLSLSLSCLTVELLFHLPSFTVFSQLRSPYKYSLSECNILLKQ
jgi:hypothetical protein